METKELAKQLGISHQMVNRYKAKGMPTDNLNAALAWRKMNVHPFQSKQGRIGGNSGLKRGAVQKKEIPTDTLIRNSISETLTHIVPHMWFGQIGWLGSVLKDHGIKLTAEQLIEVQAMLFMIYMGEVDEYLETENTFNLPDALMIRPSDQNYPSLVELLNIILAKEPKQLYGS